MTSSNKAAVSSNTDTGLGGGGGQVCESVCVCACCDMLQSRPQGSDGEIQSAQLLRPPGGGLTVCRYGSVLSLAGQGQAAGQHSSVNQSDAWTT